MTNKSIKEEFEKKFMVRNQAGLWTNEETFSTGNVWSWFDQKLKEIKSQRDDTAYAKGIIKGREQVLKEMKEKIESLHHIEILGSKFINKSEVLKLLK